MKNRKGFTIVELVIVIAVIAILAAVLIPTFSGVVGKANESAALQTARSTLTNALNMSSTAQLTGEDTNGYHTFILIDGYAYGYTGNELKGVDYPTSEKLLTKGSKLADKKWDKNFNTVIIAAENLVAKEGETDKYEIVKVNSIIKDASDIENVGDVTLVNGTYYLNYTAASGETPASFDAVVLVNVDFSNKVVVFTCFNY